MLMSYFAGKSAAFFSIPVHNQTNDFTQVLLFEIASIRLNYEVPQTLPLKCPRWGCTYYRYELSLNVIDNVDYITHTDDLNTFQTNTVCNIIS